MRRLWKALPVPVRRAANQTALAVGGAILPMQVAWWWRRGAPPGGPVIVVGLHGAVLGLGQGARLFTAALEDGGIAAYPVDASALLSRLTSLTPVHDRGPVPPGGVVVSHLNPPELELYLSRGGARMLQGRRHIGYWAWELPRAPATWRRAFAYVDEVWAPSTFTAESLRAMAPPGVPVKVCPHPMFVLPVVQSDRARFGLPQDACVVLQAFDLRSTVARKNPMGAVEAYLRAVPQPGSTACLVCKVVGAAAFPDAFDQLRASLAERPDLILIEGELSSEDMLRLTASADIVISLHRAEGFGLLPAEAMWLGKPVVATAWSGNMDFMDTESAALVDYSLVPAQDPQGMYAGAQWAEPPMWAEPDIGQAAERLAGLIADPPARHVLGARARLKAEQTFGRAAWLAAVRASLQPGGG